MKKWSWAWDKWAGGGRCINCLCLSVSKSILVGDKLIPQDKCVSPLMVIVKWSMSFFILFSHPVLLRGEWESIWVGVWLLSKVNPPRLHWVSEQSLFKTSLLFESGGASRLLSHVGKIYLWYQKGEEAQGNAAPVSGKTDVKAELGCLKGEEEGFWVCTSCCKIGRRSAKKSNGKKWGKSEPQPQQYQQLDTPHVSPWQQQQQLRAARLWHRHCWQRGHPFHILAIPLSVQTTIFSGTSVVLYITKLAHQQQIN